MRKIVALILCLMLTNLAVATIPTIANEFHSVYGLIYIDDVTAPSGIEVKLSFPGGDETDLTSEYGAYTIDFEGHENETGYFYVFYDDIWYTPIDNQSVKIGEEIGYNIDLQIDTSAPNIIYVDDDNTGGPWDGTIEHPYQYIQDGIDAVAENGTVYIFNGTYYENVVVDKTINLIGENNENTIIDGGGSGDVVYISANWVNISGFMIQHSGSDTADAGIEIQSNYTSITGNNILDNSFGIKLDSANNNSVVDNVICLNNWDGIYLLHSSTDNIISGNNISNNNDGVYLLHSSSNTVSWNTIKLNNDYGISLSSSMGNIISDNTVSGNTFNPSNNHGIFLHKSSYNILSFNDINSNSRNGIWLDSSSNNIIDNNDVINNLVEGIHLHDSSSNTITSNNVYHNDDIGINLLSHSDDNVIQQNDIRDSYSTGIRLDDYNYNNILSYNNIQEIFYDGILLGYNNTYNKILKNNISNNTAGIRILYSSNNTIEANNILNNSYYGVYLQYSADSNILYHNNFINNTNNAYDECYNIWNDTYPSGGNYWDDYWGDDEDDDGIGDVPYDLPCEFATDWYPLMFPWGEMPPVADFSYEINDLRVTFNPMNSYDRDGEIDYVVWQFGEPPVMQGPLGLVNHTYSSYGEYNVTLTVVDDDGYEGNITQVVSVEDLILPEIIDNTSSTGYTGDSFTFQATITDYAGISSSWVECWYGSGSHMNESMTNTAGDIWEKTITIDDTLETLHYLISATDMSDNWNNTETKDVTIFDNDAPEIENIHANPEIQIVGRYVNISAEVTDNIEMQSISIHLRYPDAFYEDINITDNNVGDNYFLNKTYNQIGEHRYYFEVFDTSENVVISDIYLFNTRDNEPPYAPLISGPTSGQAGEEHPYSFSTSDPNGDNIYYYIDWGDGDVVEWIGPYDPDEVIELSHTWVEEGTYIISARAKDVWGAIGDWGTLEVTMPVNRQSSDSLFLRFLERFPNAFPMLRNLLEL